MSGPAERPPYLSDAERAALANARIVADLYELEERVPEAINDLLAIITRLTDSAQDNTCERHGYEGPSQCGACELDENPSASSAQDGE